MKERIAFIGSGEMARHIAHYMVEDKQFEIVGFFDDFIEKGKVVNNYQIIGNLDEIDRCYSERKFDALINAIGYTRLQYRKDVFERFVDRIPFATFIHSTCLIDSTAKIGKGVVLFPFCILYLDSVVEDNVFIQIRSYVTDSKIKKHTIVSGSVSIAGRSVIGECCNLGISTTVNDGITLCDFVRTGSGTVVTRNISEPGTYVGVPARKI